MRPVRSLAVLAAASLTSLTGLAPAAAEADSWPVPGRAWVTIKGHGYGHGHGMSQYGAEGAARRGLTFRQINEFYYPGTSWGTAGRRVSVVISADTSDDLVVLPRRGLRVRDLGAGRAWDLPDNGAKRWRVAVRRGVDTVSYLTDRWHRWRRLEGEGVLAAGGRPVTLVTPSGHRPYRGRLRATAPAPGSRARDTVNVLRLDNYLRGVVPLEMPATWRRHAVRAQAVAARTYAAYERAHRSGPLCDTTSCQVYGGYAAEHPAADAAIEATSGLVLLHRGGPAFTQFHSSSGGWTMAGSVPYLPARRDPYDDWAGNPHHSWSTRSRETLFERRWPAVGNLRRLEVTGRDGNGEWGGRVRSLTIVGDRGRVTVSGDALRAALGLRSTWVTFVVKPRD